jgi:hypothetical protein
MDKRLTQVKTIFLIRDALQNVDLVKKPGVKTAGIVEILDAINCSISFIGLIADTYLKHAINLSGQLNLFTTLIKTPIALSEIDKIPGELEELDDVEIEIIIRRMYEEYEIEPERAVDIIRFSIDWLYSTYNLIKTLKEY